MLNKQDISEKLRVLFDELFPICRSITGPGITDSLKLIQKHVPIDIKEVPTGTEVFDWIVPREWKLNKATLCDLDGNELISTDNSNLHVLNFSEPFSGVVSRSELEDHLFSIPEFPTAIPYVTSYYQERWGICLTEEQKRTLNDNAYRVEIDTEKFDGALRFGEFDLRGETDEVILISTYLCHPSMANNELSGPLALVGLYNYLADLEKRRFTYKFVIAPETIGSISFLASKEKSELEYIVGGLVLTCLGGPSDKMHFMLSRRDWLGESSEIDKIARNLAERESEKYEVRDFTPEDGSDERQYCSPNINLPVVQAARTVYAQYDEYHTHLDDLELMTIEAVVDSIERLKLIVDCIEISDEHLESRIAGGEPQLGKRGLYPTINGPKTHSMSNDDLLDSREELNLLLRVTSLIDGTRTVMDISEKLGARLRDVLPLIAKLKHTEVIK